MSFWSTLAGLAGPIVGAVVGGPIGAAIGTGVSALGSGLAQDESNANYLQGVNDTNASNYAIAQANNKEAWRRLLQQNQFNVDMWNKQNAYNSPAAMMARLRQAGLNPAAFTGESPAAQVTSAAAPGMSTPTMQAPGQTPVADYGRLYYERIAANEMVKKAQIENADSSLRLSFLAQEKKQDLLEQAARISNMKSKTVESTWAAKKAAQEYDHFASIAKSLERGAALQVDSLEQNMKIQREENDRAWRDDARKDFETVLQYQAHQAGLKLTGAQIRQASALAADLSQSAEGRRQENRVKKIMADFEEKYNKAPGDNQIAGTTQQQHTLALLAALSRENADAELVNDWLRAHAKYLGLDVKTAQSLFNTMSMGTLFFK